MNVKLIAIDLDGTLLDSRLQLSAENKSAVRRAEDAGIKILLASGRMIRAAVPFWKVLELDTPVIGYNGALIMDVPTGRPRFHEPVDPEVVSEVVDYVRSEKVHLNLYANDEFYVEAVNEYTKYYSERYNVPYIKVNDFKDIIGRGITKMLILSEPERVAHLMQELPGIFDGRLYITRSQERYIEMMNPLVSKGTALSIVQRNLGILKDETAAIGDAPNDMEMFKQAGLSAAVANAEEEVKKAADKIIPSNDENGVAEFIDEILREADPDSD